PELLHALRPQHEPGRQLHHRDPRGPGTLRPQRAAGNAPTPSPGRRRPPRRHGRLQRGAGPGPGGHRVERRVPELLQERQREDRHPAAPDVEVVRQEDTPLPDAGVCPFMKAAVYYETGAPDVFRYEDVPDPVPGPGDILVDVEAVSIEGGDTLNRLGGALARVPHVVGYQCAGTVAAVGEAVHAFAVGDRAVTVGLDGSHAERRATPEGFAWPIP